jgi:hypothetical protein
MSWQTLFSIVAASVGAASGIWLCFGAALISPARIVQSADDSWKANPDIKGALIAQSGQYMAGGVLLIGAFALQLIAAIASISLVSFLPDGMFGIVLIVLGSLFISLSISYPIYRKGKKFLMART